ncbi:MAG: hypothetical protein QM734_04430 [Cyclobacteriaceae bacterium]
MIFCQDAQQDFDGEKDQEKIIQHGKEIHPVIIQVKSFKPKNNGKHYDGIVDEMTKFFAMYPTLKIGVCDFHKKGFEVKLI